MLNKNWRCEVCDAPMNTECSCFCNCWMNHNQCVCDFTEEDWKNYWNNNNPDNESISDL